MVELGLLPFVVPRMTVGTVTGTVFATPKISFRLPLDVIADHQVQPAVLVVVKPSCTRGPSAFVGNAGRGGNVGERAIAVIVVENGTAVAGHVKIRVAVIVEVPDGNALAVMSGSAHAGFLRDVGKRSITIIAVQRRAQRTRWFVNVGGRGLHKEEIHQAVLVIIDPSNACPHGLQVILFLSLRPVLKETDSGCRSNVGKPDSCATVLDSQGLPVGGLEMNRQTDDRDEDQNCLELRSQSPLTVFDFSPIPGLPRGRFSVRSAVMTLAKLRLFNPPPAF